MDATWTPVSGEPNKNPMSAYRIPGAAWRPALAAAVLVLGFCSVGRAQAVRVEGAFGPPEVPADAPPPHHARQLAQDDATTPTAFSISLPAVTDAEQAEWALRDRTGPAANRLWPRDSGRLPGRPRASAGVGDAQRRNAGRRGQRDIPRRPGAAGGRLCRLGPRRYAALLSSGGPRSAL